MTPHVHIVDYGVGNLRSVANALEVVGARVSITADPAEITTASHILLPGVGAFGDGIRELRRRQWPEPLRVASQGRGIPLLGICLGMQLLARRSPEHGVHEGLGWIDADVEKLPITADLRLPHVGWNTTVRKTRCQLWDGIPDEADFYFVHSYAVMAAASDPFVVGVCEHGAPFAAMVHAGNVCAVQFHPEKSHPFGLRLLENFLRLDPSAPC